MTIGYNPFDEDFNYGRLDDYKQGFKDGVEAVRIQLKEKLNEWLEDNEDNDGKIDFGIAEIELIGVKSLNGEVIAESLIDEICKELVDE